MDDDETHVLAGLILGGLIGSTFGAVGVITFAIIGAIIFFFLQKN